MSLCYTSLFHSFRGTRGEKAGWGPGDGTCLTPFLKPVYSIYLWPFSSTLLLSYTIEIESLVSLLSSRVGLDTVLASWPSLLHL